ncbi:ABC transporter ATP-binding protein [Bordetella sp. 2513F-2]
MSAQPHTVLPHAQAAMDTSASMIRVTGISKFYGSLQALREVSFDVKQGEIVALLGASGCGKSTLLNIVAGLDTFDAGELCIEGQPAASFRQWHRLAYLFQEDRLLPWRSVRDNVAFGLETRPMLSSDRRRLAERALRTVGLADFAKAWPHQLSGGMRSRVALARSLVVEPSILLMDEPFSKLDPHTRGQMHQELLRIQAETGATILFVTHDVEEAVILADRIVLLQPRPGRVKEIVDVPLDRPRLPTDRDTAELTRQLRLKVTP